MIGLPPGTTHTCSGPTLISARLRDVSRDRFAQFGQALRWSVMRPALIQRSLGSLDDVVGGREIGLADFKVDYVAAGCSSARARSRTSKADSTPIRSILSASFIDDLL